MPIYTGTHSYQAMAMTNLYWIAYYKSLIVRNLMDRKDAVMFVKSLREYEKKHGLTARQLKNMLSLGYGSRGRVGFAHMAHAGLCQDKASSK